MANSLKAVATTIKDHVNGLLAVSVVNTSNGKAETSIALDESFALEEASKYNVEVLKAKMKAKAAMGMDKEIIELITIELTSQTHFIQPSPSGTYLIYVAVDRKTANLGMARKVIKDAALDLDSVVV